MGLFDFFKKKNIQKLKIENKDEIIVFLFLFNLLSHTDGDYSDEENDFIQNYIYDTALTNEDEFSQILESVNNIEDDDIQRIVERFNKEQKKRLVTQLLSLASIDGEVSVEEAKLILTIGYMIGENEEFILSSLDELGFDRTKFENHNETKEDDFYKNITEDEKNDFFKKSKAVNSEKIFELRSKYESFNDQGKYNEAIECLTGIINEIPLLIGTSPVGYALPTDFNLILLEEIYFNRGQLYYNLDKIEDAKKDYLKAIQVNPRRKESIFYHHLGCSKIILNEIDADLIEDFNKAIAFYDESRDNLSYKVSDSFYQRGSVKFMLKDLQSAKDDLLECLNLSPEDNSAKNLLKQINAILEIESDDLLNYFTNDVQFTTEEYLKIKKEVKSEEFNQSHFEDNLATVKSWIKTYNEEIGFEEIIKKSKRKKSNHEISMAELIFLKIQLSLILEEDMMSIVHDVLELCQNHKYFKPNKGELGSKIYYEVSKM